MGEFPWCFHISWTSAVQLVLSVGVLFGVVGVGALPGLVPLFICGLINVPFAKILQHYMAQFMISQDERLRSTSEILNSMKIIKLQSWEDKFKNLVENLRAKEFIWLSKTQIMKAYGTICIYIRTGLCNDGSKRENSHSSHSSSGVSLTSGYNLGKVMEGGKVTQAGNYVNLLTSGTAFEQLVSAHKEAITELEQNNENKTHTKESQGFYLIKNRSEGEISYKGQLGTAYTRRRKRDW
ncbi:hypothetical protein JHK87_043441 [Glycine soja]|nr:hypothetical protein JHK87_043441 [Glycine soja]